MYYTYTKDYQESVHTFDPNEIEDGNTIQGGTQKSHTNNNNAELEPPKYLKFEYYDAPGSVEFKSKSVVIQTIIKNRSTFYLIRHGQGVHNKLKAYNPKRWITKIYDTPLTNEGKEQAGKAAIALRKIVPLFKGGAKTYMKLNQINKADMVFFVSDLY